MAKVGCLSTLREGFARVLQLERAQPEPCVVDGGELHAERVEHREHVAEHVAADCGVGGRRGERRAELLHVCEAHRGRGCVIDEHRV